VPGYEVLEELGRGGMGVVYKARQLGLNRLVALKMIRDGALAGPQERTRFRIEAEAAARMRHPNVVQIYEVGEHGGGPYFVMELVEGGSLDRHLAGRPLPAREAAELVRTVALAVQHAHDQKIVHRDLKPANILLQEETTTNKTNKEEEREANQAATAAPSSPPSSIRVIRSIRGFTPKITDFSLAKRLDAQTTALTQDGAVLGTANYMAPEQAAGRIREVGPAADLYALGAILYELLTGRPPFLADSWDQMLRQVLHDEPASPARVQPAVPAALETVCLHCLEKEPGRRYASAGDLADDLGRFLEGKTVAAVPLGAAERLARLAARDGYEIVGEVGRGPHGTVYQARQGPLQQAVVLKVFPAGACTREAWEACLREGAELWAAIAHPHVVPVHQGGWWDGIANLAVEYVPHGSLAARLAGQPYPVRQAVRLVEQLAETVAYLHRQGVVHGNLKPSNVLLAAEGIPRVADIRLPGGLFHGTPADGLNPAGLGYLAPELVGEPGAEPRPHTDVYGLGVILYELLTGRPPFAGASASELLEQVRSQEPIPPSRLNPEVPPQLERLCLRCLRKNRWQRYSRAYDLLVYLRYCKEGEERQEGVSPRRPRRRPPGPTG
jgi:serine/threonine protein kinase